VPVVDVYARLSKAPDGETVKVDDQVEQCTEKILDRGGQVGEVFKDNSLSAWNPKVVRPQWDALMARLEARLSDGVMVYGLTRFSRKILEGERLVELASNGVRVWALAGEYDLTTADGRRHFREAMVAAAGESDKISERVKRGKLRRARKGWRPPVQLARHVADPARMGTRRPTRPCPGGAGSGRAGGGPRVLRPVVRGRVGVLAGSGPQPAGHRR
jgi:DNA invertase Pin-like site-specific DNA recombinase